MVAGLLKGYNFISKNVSLIDTMALGEARFVAAYLVTGEAFSVLRASFRSSE